MTLGWQGGRGSQTTNAPAYRGRDSVDEKPTDPWIHLYYHNLIYIALDIDTLNKLLLALLDGVALQEEPPRHYVNAAPVLLPDKAY